MGAIYKLKKNNKIRKKRYHSSGLVGIGYSVRRHVIHHAHRRHHGFHRIRRILHGLHQCYVRRLQSI